MNIHDELQNGNLIPSNLENISYNMGGVFSNTLRMSLGSSAIKSSVNGKLAYSGSYIVSLDMNNLNRMVSLEPYSYMNIGYLKGNKMISYFKNSIIYTGRSKYFNSAPGADILSIVNPRGQIEKLIYSTTSQTYFNISNVFQNGNDLLIMGGSSSPFTMFNQSLGTIRASIAAFKVKF